MYSNRGKEMFIEQKLSIHIKEEEYTKDFLYNASLKSQSFFLIKTVNR